MANMVAGLAEHSPNIFPFRFGFSALVGTSTMPRGEASSSKLTGAHEEDLPNDTLCQRKRMI